jgi:sulfur carrier protein
MLVRINGERKQVSAVSIQELLGELEYEGSHFAIAVNCRVVPRARWSATSVNEADEIEILTPRQGG